LVHKTDASGYGLVCVRCQRVLSFQFPGASAVPVFWSWSADNAACSGRSRSLPGYFCQGTKLGHRAVQPLLRRLVKPEAHAESNFATKIRRRAHTASNTNSQVRVQSCDLRAFLSTSCALTAA
jgi:hypothetical protein